LFIAVCEEISTTNHGIRQCCKSQHISTRTFYDWVELNEKNKQQYLRAREQQADVLVEEIIEIADDSTNDTKTITKGKELVEVENTEWTNRSKLRVEARKWIAAKLRPKRYGDKLDVTTDGAKLSPAISDDQLTSIIAKINGNAKK